MPIIIENITREHRPTGINKYRLRINDKVICEYTHNRSYDGLAECLRDAAEAVDALGLREGQKVTKDEIDEFFQALDESRKRYP